MAKFDTDDIGKPGKPPKARPFPWRLWLYAIVMTGAAGVGGYYAWQYRKEARVVVDDAVACRASTAKLQTEASDATKKATDCLAQLASTIQRTKELEAAQAAPGTGPKDEASLKRLAAIDEIQRQLAKMSEANQLKVTARRGSVVLSMPAEPMFAPGTAELTKPGELALLEVGITLKRYPERRLLVTGHTDDTPPKNAAFKDNWELSVARALAVTKLLVQAGMEPRNLITAGAADSDPLGKDRAKNARIEITQLATPGELPPLPPTLGPDTAGAAAPPAAKAEAPKAVAPPKAEAAGPDPAKPAAKP